MSDVSAAGGFWDREVVHKTHTSWMEHPLVRDYVNASVGGEGGPSWPVDWFVRWSGGRRFRRGLSIGCGTGPLERDLLKKDIVGAIDAFDGSTHSLLIAQREAEREGVGERVRYFAMDFNEPSLPRKKYDIVFFHQSLHHVAKLEKLLRAVLLSLKPDGVLYLDEYIGPSRFDWSDVLIAPHREAYDAMPAAAKRFERLAFPIQADDPSEAFRSSEILPQLAIGFDTVAFRGYGGNLLSVLYPAMEPSDDLVAGIIDRERALLHAGAIPYYAVIVARPRRAIGKTLASWRYFAEPKLKRLMREARARLQPAG